jgi:hypothetical protein
MDDEARYIVPAQSIARGQGPRSLQSPDESVNLDTGLGFSLMLAPAIWLWPDNVIALKLVSVGCGLLTILLVYRLLTSYAGLDNYVALGIALLNAVAPLPLLFIAGEVLSETSYTFFSLLALWWLERALRSDRQATSNEMLSGLAMGFATLVRVVGVTLIGAELAYLVCKRRFRQAAWVALGVAMILAPWLLWRCVLMGPAGLNVGYSGTFLRQAYQSPKQATWQDILLRVAENAWGHATDTTLRLMLPTLTGGRLLNFLGRIGLDWLPAGVGLALVGLMALGFVVSAWRGLRAYHVYTLFYTVFILLPPWFIARNLLPVLPFLLLFLVRGLEWLASWVGHWRRLAISPRSVALLALGLMLASGLLSDRYLLRAAAEYRNGTFQGFDRSFAEAAGWLRTHTAPDDLVLFKYPLLLHLHTGRKAMGAGMRTPEEMLAYIRQQGVDYVMLNPEPLGSYYDDPHDQVYLKPVVDSYPGIFIPIYTTPSEPKLTIFRINAPGLEVKR